MRQFLKPLLALVMVLAIPIVPFVVLGDSFESRVEAWLDRTLPPWAVAMLVVGLLSSDILLPIPSSVVSTFAGNRLGFVWATAASWAGMTLGAVAAFWLVRRFGRPLAVRLSSEEELVRMDRLAARFGPVVLVLARPVPVLAEASVLLFGATQLSFGRFFLPLALSNLGLAATYAWLGERVQLPVALAASLAIPLVAAGVTRHWWPREST